MKSQWKVKSNRILGTKYYQVFRIINSNEETHSGNMEDYGGLHETKEVAQAIADKLNEQEVA